MLKGLGRSPQILRLHLFSGRFTSLLLVINLNRAFLPESAHADVASDSASKSVCAEELYSTATSWLDAEVRLSVPVSEQHAETGQDLDKMLKPVCHRLQRLYHEKAADFDLEREQHLARLPESDPFPCNSPSSDTSPLTHGLPLA